MRPLLTIFVAINLLGTALPLFGAEEAAPSDQVTTTERLDFPAGGTIYVDRSYGDLRVEGWDRPEVEMTATKTLLRFGESKTPAQDQRRLGDIHMALQRKSTIELTVMTTLASRHTKWPPPIPRTTTRGVKAEYEIHVPRDSKLVIHHSTGSVFVSGVAGDLDVSCGRGDIVLWVPPVEYAIDARTKLGKVTLELRGDTLSRYLVGQRFTRSPSLPAHRLHLRMGFGGITIEPILPESEMPATH